MRAETIAEAIDQIGPEFGLGGFAQILQPLIKETLEDHNKSKFRKGTILMWLI